MMRSPIARCAFHFSAFDEAPGFGLGENPPKMRFDRVRRQAERKRGFRSRTAGGNRSRHARFRFGESVGIHQALRADCPPARGIDDEDGAFGIVHLDLPEHADLVAPEAHHHNGEQAGLIERG
jgi:hypothetical protein